MFYNESNSRPALNLGNFVKESIANSESIRRLVRRLPESWIPYRTNPSRLTYPSITYRAQPNMTTSWDVEPRRIVTNPFLGDQPTQESFGDYQNRVQDIRNSHQCPHCGSPLLRGQSRMGHCTSCGSRFNLSPAVPIRENRHDVVHLMNPRSQNRLSIYDDNEFEPTYRDRDVEPRGEIGLTPDSTYKRKSELNSDNLWVEDRERRDLPRMLAFLDRTTRGVHLDLTRENPSESTDKITERERYPRVENTSPYAAWVHNNSRSITFNGPKGSDGLLFTLAHEVAHLHWNDVHNNDIDRLHNNWTSGVISDTDPESIHGADHLMTSAVLSHMMGTHHDLLQKDLQQRLSEVIEPSVPKYSWEKPTPAEKAHNEFGELVKNSIHDYDPSNELHHPVRLGSPEFLLRMFKEGTAVRSNFTNFLMNPESSIREYQGSAPMLLRMSDGSIAANAEHPHSLAFASLLSTAPTSYGVRGGIAESYADHMAPHLLHRAGYGTEGYTPHSFTPTLAKHFGWNTLKNSEGV